MNVKSITVTLRNENQRIILQWKIEFYVLDYTIELFQMWPFLLTSIAQI